MNISPNLPRVILWVDDCEFHGRLCGTTMSGEGYIYVDDDEIPVTKWPRHMWEYSDDLGLSAA